MVAPAIYTQPLICMKKLIIGTRGSQLALAQARETVARLRVVSPELETELRILKTQGDKRLDLALDASGDKGLFTSELERALISGEIDLAVHSLKDLPVEPALGTMLSAILPREEGADALLGKCRLSELKKGAIIGTSSPRRVAQLKVVRPDLVFAPIRGNVETRIDKMHRGEYDAIVMAVAGLKRLSLEAEISDMLDYQVVTPAPGQAAIALQQRVDDSDTEAILSQLDCPHTRLAVETERAVLSGVGGGCAMPLGVHCTPEAEDVWRMYAFYQRGAEPQRFELTFTSTTSHEAIQRAVALLTTSTPF